MPGFASSWGVNTEAYRDSGLDGFQYFRII